jgi:hypothetical protein
VGDFGWVGGARNTNNRDERDLVVKIEEKCHSEDPEVDGKLILKNALNK